MPGKSADKNLEKYTKGSSFLEELQEYKRKYTQYNDFFLRYFSRVLTTDFRIPTFKKTSIWLLPYVSFRDNIQSHDRSLCSTL